LDRNDQTALALPFELARKREPVTKSTIVLLAVAAVAAGGPSIA
jgi:hypothetical protein